MFDGDGNLYLRVTGLSCASVEIGKEDFFLNLWNGTVLRGKGEMMIGCGCGMSLYAFGKEAG